MFEPFEGLGIEFQCQLTFGVHGEQPGARGGPKFGEPAIHKTADRGALEIDLVHHARGRDDLRLIGEVGFALVLEQYDHLDAHIAWNMREGPYMQKDRSMFVGIKV